MIDKEKIIRNYIDGYNQFHIDKMIADFDDTVVFENIQHGDVTLSLSGLAAFRQQAEQAKRYFTTRKQSIKSITHLGDAVEVGIDYRAVIAFDLSDELKQGDELNLTGTSIFRFLGNKVIELKDIS